MKYLTSTLRQLILILYSIKYTNEKQHKLITILLEDMQKHMKIWIFNLSTSTKSQDLNWLKKVARMWSRLTNCLHSTYNITMHVRNAMQTDTVEQRTLQSRTTHRQLFDEFNSNYVEHSFSNTMYIGAKASEYVHTIRLW